MSGTAPHLSQLATSVEPSVTLALSQRAGELKAQGHTVHNFTAGEPDFNPPDAVIAAAHQAIDQGYHKYTAADGMPDLKSAIALWHEQHYGYRPDLPEIVVTAGAKPAIALTLMAILDPGDEVLIPAPYWVSYPSMVQIAQGRPAILPARADGQPDLSAASVAAAATDRTKAIILNNPGNPSGSLLDGDTLAGLLRLAQERGWWVLSDDIYHKLTYDKAPWRCAGADPGSRSRTAVIDGVSKTFAMTGWRIGWLVAPKPLARAAARLQGQLLSNPTAVAQRAALAALTDPGVPAAVEGYRQRFEQRRDLMTRLLNEVPGLHCPLPGGAFYAFADARELMAKKNAADDNALCARLIDEARVLPVPGSGFGAPGWLRFSFATSEAAIEAGMAALRRWAEN